jgi:hypothetical protein
VGGVVLHLHGLHMPRRAAANVLVRRILRRALRVPYRRLHPTQQTKRNLRTLQTTDRN